MRQSNETEGEIRKCRTAVTVRCTSNYTAEQGSVYAPAIGIESVGSQVLWFGEISLPPGARTRAHRHDGHETALLMTAGDEVEIWSGSSLECRERICPGDYLFIPSGVPHVAVNRSAHHARFVGARNDPRANESVVLMPELDAVVP